MPLARIAAAVAQFLEVVQRLDPGAFGVCCSGGSKVDRGSLQYKC